MIIPSFMTPENFADGGLTFVRRSALIGCGYKTQNTNFTTVLRTKKLIGGE